MSTMSIMKKFYVFSMLAYGLLAIHILEESTRLGRENAEAGVLLPFIVFPIGFIGMYFRKQWGFWMVWLMSILVALLPALSHLIPSSSSYLGIMYSFWGGVIGAGAVLVAVFLSIFGIVAVVAGIKIIYGKQYFYE